MTIEVEKVSRGLEEYVGCLVRRFKPKRVVLFGSHAYGKPKEASDVDLLVVMETPLRPVEQAIAIRSVISAPFPLDLIVRTPDQVERRLSMGDFFLREVLSQGKVLYESSD